MAKEEQFLILVLIITLLGIAYSINLSQESLTKKLDETFLVICKDESGQSVMWKGPKGALNGKTRPQVQHASYGTAIYFNKTKKEDTGNYTCILTGSPNVRKVFSLTVQDIKPPTPIPTDSDYEEYDEGDDYDDYPTPDDTDKFVKTNEPDKVVESDEHDDDQSPDPDNSVEPNEYVEPNKPVESNEPVEHYEPIEPDQPVKPNDPVEPNESVTPVNSDTPPNPIKSVINTGTDAVDRKKYTKPIAKIPKDDSFEDYVRNDDRVFYGNYDDTEDYVNYSPNASNYEDNVEEPLKFRDTPKTRTAVEGEKSITLVCRVNWRDVDIRWSLASKEALDKKILILPRGLYIPNVTRDDANVYQCEAHHVTSGTRITQDITLDVHHKPSLPYEAFAEEDEVYVFLDEPVNLTCEVEANPPPTFEWRRRNMGKVLNISTHISVLQLNVTDETPGTFQCTASNKEGKLDKYFDVQLGEHPEMPTNIKLLEANTDSLKLKIEVPDIPYEVRDPVMDPQWIVVEYKPKSENEWIRAEFNITNEEVVLTNLSKNTKYEIQAATRNIAGLSQYYSNQTIFETSPAISVHTKFPIVIYSTFILTFLIWIA